MNKIFDADKIDYYISANVFSKPQTPLRKTNEYEIELYTTSGNISVIDGTQYLQKRGNVLIAKPGSFRYSIGSFECYCVHFMCNDADISEAIDSLPPVFAYNDAEELEKVFKRLIKTHYLQGAAKTLYIQGSLMEIISLLLAENSKKYSGKYEEYINNISLACDFIKKNFEAHITLNDISAVANLSPGFFHKVFKSIKNITPAQYLAEIRLENAKNMLKKSKLPFAEIAVLCGFGSQGYFNYVFKKQTGTTPKSYRVRNQIII